MRVMVGMYPSRRVAHAMTMIGFAAATCAIGSPAAHAKTELTVSPLLIELDASAGDELVEQIAVTAGQGEAIVVELVHADFGFEDEAYDVVLIRDDAPDTTSFSTRGWFSLPKERYRIPAGRTVALPLQISIPKNSPSGTYLGAALVRVVPPASRAGASQVQAVAEAGPLLFISVEGGDPPKAAVREFELPKLVSGGPIRPDIVVENRGDEFFTFEGSVRLRGPGKDDSVAVARQFVVPGQPRRLRTAPDEKGREGRPSLGSTKVGFGRYEVSTRLRIEPTGTTLVSTRTIWVIPTWTRILAVIALLVLAGSIALLVRWVIERRRLAPFQAEQQAEGRNEDVEGDHDRYDEDLDDEFEDEPFVR